MKEGRERGVVTSRPGTAGRGRGVVTSSPGTAG